MQRRACFEAACVVAVGTTGAVDGAAMAMSWGTADGVSHDAALVRVQAPGMVWWSDRRQCPLRRANSLDSVVPENLPRTVSLDDVAAAYKVPAPTPVASPDAVVPFLVLCCGSMGCFSL
jgi:hypothetical protein